MSSAIGRWGGLLALILLNGCASLRPRSAHEVSEAVEAEGWAPVDRKDGAGTRERALADAQKKAVEKVAGVYLAASTRIDAAITIRQKIMADVRGHIRRYEVLGEKTESGFLKIRIRAIVVRPNPLEDSQAMSSITNAPPPESPKVRVVINDDASHADVLNTNATSAVESRLMERGFQIDKAGIEASTAGSNLEIRGQVRTMEIKDSHLGGFLSYRARITLEVLEPGTRNVLWKHSEEAAALGLNAESASSQAIENAGVLIGKAAADNLTTYLWKHF